MIILYVSLFFVVFCPHRNRRIWTCFYPGTRWCYFSFRFWRKESDAALWGTRKPTTYVQVGHSFVCFHQLIRLVFITSLLLKKILLLFFSWYINGTKVDAKTDFRYSFIDGDLIITNASETTDYGKYQCKTENSFGTLLSRDALLQFACE